VILIAPFRLAFLELKRFRTPLQIAGLLFLLCVPLLYGAIYLWSNWNPYGRLASVPVAVVNEDEAVTVGGQTVTAGATLEQQLKSRPLLGWRFVSARQASGGLRDGRYYAVITVPSDFSARLASGATGPPQRASMNIRLDDANNYLVGVMADTVQSELEREVAASAVTAYFQTAFGKLGELKQGLGTAASGANTLRSGLGTAQQGSTALLSGLEQLRSGSGKLRSGAAAVAAGISTVDSLEAPIARHLAEDLPGLARRSAAAAGAATALSGTVARVTQTVADIAGQLLTWVEQLPRQAPQLDPQLGKDPLYQALIQQLRTDPAAGGLATGLARLAAAHPAITQLPGYAGAVVGAHLADGTFAWLLSQLAAHDPAVAGDPVYGLLLKLATQLDGWTHQVNDQAQGINGYVWSVNDAVRTLQGQVPYAQARLRSAATQLDRLNAGAAAVSSGLGTLKSGVGSAVHGASRLRDGNGQLLSGARQLAGGLSSAQGQVPTFATEDASVLATPVNVMTSNMHPADVYGRGLAPFFFSIALWVFGIVAFLLLRPVSGRLLAAGAGSWLVALAAWLPVLAMGAGGALLLFTVVDLFLGLNPVDPVGTVGLMLLGVAAFSAIVHVLRLAFGAVGDAIALVLLMLQLVSCGGLYPVETLPLPFRALNRVVPMTYLVRGLRVTISGGSTTVLWHCVLALAGFTLVSLALLWLAVSRQQVWSMARLKPELELLPDRPVGAAAPWPRPAAH
jgi:putative membrane protein